MQDHVVQRATEHGVLLVKLKDMPEVDGKGSILTERQRQWLNSTTYDSTTLNPVIYK